jgi:hypothetical protein
MLRLIEDHLDVILFVPCGILFVIGLMHPMYIIELLFGTATIISVVGLVWIGLKYSRLNPALSITLTIASALWLTIPHFWATFALSGIKTQFEHVAATPIEIDTLTGRRWRNGHVLSSDVDYGGNLEQVVAERQHWLADHNMVYLGRWTSSTNGVNGVGLYLWLGPYHFRRFTRVGANRDILHRMARFFYMFIFRSNASVESSQTIDKQAFLWYIFT